MIPKFLAFLTAIGPALYDLFVHIDSGVDDPEREKQLALNVVRQAKDAQARQEIAGS